MKIVGPETDIKEIYWLLSISALGLSKSSIRLKPVDCEKT
jgi:hypothetical protein